MTSTTQNKAVSHDENRVTDRNELALKTPLDIHTN